MPDVCCHSSFTVFKAIVAGHHIYSHQRSSSFQEPEFTKSISNLKLAVGKEAMMRCSVKNLGPHKVSWTHVDTQTLLAIHNHVVSKHSKIEIKHENDENWFLIIKNVSLEDKGYYMCQISSKPPKSQVGYLEVVGKIDTYSDFSCLKFVRFKVAPQFEESSLKSGANVTVREHQNVTLSCKARGNPEPKIKWTREDNKPIFTQQSSAENVPPMIKIPTKVVTASVGQNITLVCITESNPLAQHQWIDPLDNFIENNHHYRVKTERTYHFKITFKLIIFEIDFADSGNYACLVENDLGSAKGGITLQ
ncbi:lachesin-like isoform X6, partial [Dinothrombium tinctorium]